MRRFPEAKSGKWWIWAGVSSIAATLLLWLVRFVILGQQFDGVYAFRFMLLGTGLSLLFGLFGWLGARKLWLFSTIGLAAGLALMAGFSRNATGWEDLISLIVFFEAAAVGFAVGLLVECVFLAVKLLKK